MLVAWPLGSIIAVVFISLSCIFMGALWTMGGGGRNIDGADSMSPGPTVPQQRILTSDDIRRAAEDPGVVLSGRVTVDTLRSFVRARLDCGFSETMAQGTDSWANQAMIFLDLPTSLDLSGVTGMDDAVEQLSSGLTQSDIDAAIASAAALIGDMRVAIEDVFVRIHT